MKVFFLLALLAIGSVRGILPIPGMGGGDSAELEEDNQTTKMVDANDMGDLTSEN